MQLTADHCQEYFDSLSLEDKRAVARLIKEAMIQRTSFSELIDRKTSVHLQNKNDECHY